MQSNIFDWRWLNIFSLTGILALPSSVSSDRHGRLAEVRSALSAVVTFEDDHSNIGSVRVTAGATATPSPLFSSTNQSSSSSTPSSAKSQRMNNTVRNILQIV